VSLRWRLALIFAGIMGLTLAIFGVVLYVAMRTALETEMDRRLQVRASLVQLSIWPGTTSLTAEDLTSARLDLAPLTSLNAPNTYVQVLGRDGQVIAVSENLHGTSLPVLSHSVATALRGETVMSDVEVEPGHAVRVLSAPIRFDRNIVGVLQVGQSRLPLQETMDGLARLLQILGLIAALVAGAVGWVLAQRGLRDLSVISTRAAAISASRDFRQRLRLKRGDDEVAQLARTIDELLVTIDDTLRTHREFVSDASHELRNPLLALQTNLELLEQEDDPQARAECLAEARLQVRRMSRLVSDLLVLAQREARLVVERRPTPLRLLAEHIAHEAEHRASGQHVRLGRVDPVTVLADEDRLAQILTNLVDNALKHTPPGGTVQLSVEQVDGHVDLTVTDDGAGIAPEHLPRIFDRFYRADGRGTGPDGGTGLGLAIARHLTEAHGGQISVDSKPGRGSRFIVRLPLPPSGLTTLPISSEASPDV
jgi:two-component system, OmpR family, sensor kinase